MTKAFKVRIMVDETVAQWVTTDREVGRCRTLAKVRPAGMKSALQVSELLLPAGEQMDLSEPLRREYEAAFRAFLAGKWGDTARRLTFADGPSEFLKRFIAENPAGPPTGWDGIIAMKAK